MVVAIDPEIFIINWQERSGLRLCSTLDSLKDDPADADVCCYFFSRPIFNTNV